MTQTVVNVGGWVRFRSDVSLGLFDSGFHTCMPCELTSYIVT